MRLRHRYLLAGVAWALFLAPVATYSALAIFLGVLWLYVFGDNPFPAWLDWFVPVVVTVVFISTAACSIYLAYRYGREREIEAEVDDPRERRRVLLWGLAPMALIAITAVFLWQRSEDRAEAIAETEGREVAFMELLDARHTIADLGVHPTEGSDFEVRVATSGGKPGPHRLYWQINSMPYGEILSHEEQDIEMDHDAGETSFEISIDDLALSYLDRIFNGGVGGILVDEPFELVVTLQPVIDEGDIEAWPAFQRYLWSQGESPLASSMEMDFPVFFRVEQDGTINYSTP